ncbi:U32 family peptidase [Clostridium sp. JN-1]|uniref:U32 family peptidase n=1 Tax=Clostridium sp. JN-1 TaxID=2483110 RepID=UPI000F0B5B44|nr:U32 family peptidase [Clostridium sp. JN-1]
MKKVELLAPAGSMESLYAAVQSGADAVYLGGDKFSARAYASNFDNENIKKSVKYCHLYGVKVYVTINILLKDSEMKEALRYAEFLYNSGVDALIIQDIGFAYCIKKLIPDFEIHASTQMTVHNAEGAKFLNSIGFKRIVLSRELSLKEIEYISKDLHIETEIFIHGALCVCYSGQCLMSSLIGGRSGNRGRCAQPCRLPYTIIDEKNKLEKNGYLLSPKDICTLENIRDIIDSGTTSLKIEGRMKRPEYVAGVVSAYRKAIDLAVGLKSDADLSVEKKKLLQLFNREGFSKAYLYGNVGRDMMAYSFPKNTGTFLGKVNKDLSVLLQEDISLKDGVRYENDGFTVSKIIKNNNEVKEAKKGDIVILKPSHFKSGNTLYKTSDSKLFKELQDTYNNPFERKINLDLNVSFKLNETVKLSTCFNNKDYSAQGLAVQKAIKKPISMEELKKHLGKSGDTPFKFSNIRFENYEAGFLPVSEINEVRRKLVEQIEMNLLNGRKKVKVNLNEIFHGNINRRETGSIPKYMVCVNNEEQLKAVKDSGFKDVIIDMFYKSKDNLEYYIMKNSDLNLWIKVPNIVRDEFDTMCKKIDTLIPHINGIVTANLGIISVFKNKTSIISDYKLNVFNEFGVRQYSEFMDSVCLSVELNKIEIEKLLRTSRAKTQILVYGKIENMVSEYCPIGSTLGGKGRKNNCSHKCSEGTFNLKDRIGAEFLVRTDKYCRSHIYNSVPLNLTDKIEELTNMGASSFRIDFIDEKYGDVINVLEFVKNKKTKGDFVGFTKGHYKRGVE